MTTEGLECLRRLRIDATHLANSIHLPLPPRVPHPTERVMPHLEWFALLHGAPVQDRVALSRCTGLLIYEAMAVRAYSCVTNMHLTKQISLGGPHSITGNAFGRLRHSAPQCVSPRGITCTGMKLTFCGIFRCGSFPHQPL